MDGGELAMEKTAPSFDPLRMAKPGNGKSFDGKLQASGTRGSIPKNHAQDINPEDELIRAANGGSLEAFNQLVLAYQDRVYNQAYSLLGDPMAAEDAAQEAFIAAYRALSTFRGGSFQAWFSRIVTNKCLDELRRRASHGTIPLLPRNRYGEEIESPSWSVDPGEGPEVRLERAELADRIKRCLERLNPDQRAILVLVDVLSMSYREAAEATGWPLGTVKSRLARARVKMQGLMKRNLPAVRSKTAEKLESR
jgi:RNA polymerase sigma-70 factor (ECF subfamily)